MNILVPSVPKRLKITEMMVCDFIVDPVMGIKVVMGVSLDHFQAYIIRQYHFCQNVLNSSGVSTGKSLLLFLYQNYRALIIEGQWCGQFFQNFEAGKQTFWPYYARVRGPIFRAHLGQVDLAGEEAGKANLKGPACWTQHFRNGSKVMMPAPNWGQDAKGLASYRFNCVGIDEWTKAETYGRADGNTAGGINEQILGRLTKEHWGSEEHPIWGNRLILTATAEGLGHPAYARYLVFKREVDAGNPNYAIISRSYKDFSNKRTPSGETFRKKYRKDTRMKAMKDAYAPWHYVQEVLGIWSRAGKGWYRQEAIQSCIDKGAAAKVEAMSHRDQSTDDLTENPWYYFLGIDPAPAEGPRSDDGALAAVRVRLKPHLLEAKAPGLESSWRQDGPPPLPFSQHANDWVVQAVYACILRRANAEQWSGKIHQVHQNFRCTGILMDPNGGGQWIRQVLNKSRQNIDGIYRECTPIITVDDGTAPHGEPILTMFKLREPGIEALWPALKGDDNLIDAAHVQLQECIERGDFLLPLPLSQRATGSVRALKEQWPVERHWALVNLSVAIDQFLSIAIGLDTDGNMLLTRNHARQYSARGKKDLAYALLDAYVRFLVWLRHGEATETYQGDDAGMCWVSGR